MSRKLCKSNFIAYFTVTTNKYDENVLGIREKVSRNTTLFSDILVKLWN